MVRQCLTLVDILSVPRHCKLMNCAAVSRIPISMTRLILRLS